MAWFDIVVGAVVGLSLLLGAVRGLVRELISLAAWVVALVLARSLAPTLALWLPAMVQPESVRHGIGFVAVTVVALVTIGILSILLSAMVKAAGLSATDRVFGAIFGLARGLLIVLVGVVIAGLTELPRDAGWRRSVLAPTFEAAAVWIGPWLPAPIASRMKFT